MVEKEKLKIPEWKWTVSGERGKKSNHSKWSCGEYKERQFLGSKEKRRERRMPRSTWLQMRAKLPGMFT